MTGGLSGGLVELTVELGSGQATEADMIRAFLEKKVPGEMLPGNLLGEISGNNLPLPTHFLEPLNTAPGADTEIPAACSPGNERGGKNLQAEEDVKG